MSDVPGTLHYTVALFCARYRTCIILFCTMFAIMAGVEGPLYNTVQKQKHLLLLYFYLPSPPLTAKTAALYTAHCTGTVRILPALYNYLSTVQ
jgi:hypothetical protein